SSVPNGRRAERFVVPHLPYPADVFPEKVHGQRGELWLVMFSVAPFHPCRSTAARCILLGGSPITRSIATGNKTPHPMCRLPPIPRSCKRIEPSSFSSLIATAKPTIV